MPTGGQTDVSQGPVSLPIYPTSHVLIYLGLLASGWLQDLSVYLSHCTKGVSGSLWKGGSKHSVSLLTGLRVLENGLIWKGGRNKGKPMESEHLDKSFQFSLV